MALHAGVVGNSEPTIHSNALRFPNQAGLDAVEYAKALDFGLDEWQESATAATEVSLAGICAPRQQGKTYLGLTRAITAAVVEGETVVYLTISNHLSRNAFERTIDLIMQRPALRDSVGRSLRNPGAERIEFLRGGSITFSTARRPKHCHRMIVDDAMMMSVPLAQIIMSAGKDLRHLLMLGSAPHLGLAYGPFCDLRGFALKRSAVRLGGRTPDWLPTVFDVSDMAWLEWAVLNAYDKKGNLQIDPYAPEVIATANPAYGRRSRNDDHFMRREALVMRQEDFLVERLGISTWS